MENRSKQNKAYMSIKDVKNYLGISTTAAYELAHRKDFPVCRFGSSIRVPTELFQLWIDSHTYVPVDLQDAYTQKKAAV